MPTHLFNDPMRESRWQARFAAPRPGFPEWAQDAPHRSLYTCNTSGACEIHVWDRERNIHRQVTHRRSGTNYGALSTDGQRIWWFADTDGDEFGDWMIEPFDRDPGDGQPALAAPGVPSGYPAGLALGRTVTMIGVTTDDGTTIWTIRPGQAPAVLDQYLDDAELIALSRDERFVAIALPQHGDSRHMALRVLCTDTAALIAAKSDGPGNGLDAFAFSPVAGDHRLLVQHERRGRPELAIWDVDADTETELDLGLPGELRAQWYPAGEALLVIQHYHARSTLHRYDLRTGELSPMPTPAGTIDAAAVRPDGSIEYLWSSAEHPPTVRARCSEGDHVLFELPGGKPPAGPRLEDAWVNTHAGNLHVLVARPRRDCVLPTVFLLHGGPHAADEDRFSAYRAVWTDAGFAVVHVNYRGSTGYGTAWRDAIQGHPGLAELADVAAAADWAISSGIADPARCVIAGASWGGYLTLLGLGVQPQRWAAGVAEAPIADHTAAYAERPDFLQAFDRALFGGSPEEQPELYRECSPITYVTQVRAPVLIIAGDNDPRCPIRQIDAYLARLDAADIPHQAYRYDAGHSTLVVSELIRQAILELSFVADVLGLNLNEQHQPHPRHQIERVSPPAPP